MDSSTIILWTGPFLISAVSGWSLLLSCFKELSEFNANNVDPDQMPHSAASDLGQHCLPMSLLWDARLKWVDICGIKIWQFDRKGLFASFNFGTLILSDVCNTVYI